MHQGSMVNPLNQPTVRSALRNQGGQINKLELRGVKLNSTQDLFACQFDSVL